MTIVARFCEKSVYTLKPKLNSYITVRTVTKAKIPNSAVDGTDKGKYKNKIK